MSENILRLFSSELKVINIGLELFKDALEAQGVDVASQGPLVPAKAGIQSESAEGPAEKAKVAAPLGSPLSRG